MEVIELIEHALEIAAVTAFKDAVVIKIRP
jgi:hypothetical protein